MNNIIFTLNFERDLKRLVKKYPPFRKDMAELVASLKENALQGSEPFPNVRKIRLSITGKSRGKSGGARVIIYVRIEKEQVYCLYLYDKAEISDIPDHEIKDFVKELLAYFESEDDEKQE